MGNRVFTVEKAGLLLGIRTKFISFPNSNQAPVEPEKENGVLECGEKLPKKENEEGGVASLSA